MGETVGIETRHARSCPVFGNADAACKCKPTFQANVWSAREKKRIRKTFPTITAARNWRADARGSLRRGTMKTPTQTTLRQAWEAWEAGAKDGSIRTRSGDAYKPSAIRSYSSAMRLRLLDEFGGAKLSDIDGEHLQSFVGRLLAEGLDPSTIRNAIMPLRAIYRQHHRQIPVNPTAGLELPAVRGRRERIVSPDEARRFLSALREEDRALWATALYAGLRRGELMALRWEDVDLAAGKIRVERSWDTKAGPIEPKSRAGRRVVPIPSVLREYLVAHKLRCPLGEGLVFGRLADAPFTDSAALRRAVTAVAKMEAKRQEALAEAESDLLIADARGDEDALAAVRHEVEALEAARLEPLGLHEARHTFASLMIAAGVNAKALSTYMGHSSITITLDRYGHLFPGNEGEAAELLDAYLVRVAMPARAANVPR